MGIVFDMEEMAERNAVNEQIEILNNCYCGEPITESALLGAIIGGIIGTAIGIARVKEDQGRNLKPEKIKKNLKHFIDQAETVQQLQYYEKDRINGIKQLNRIADDMEGYQKDPSKYSHKLAKSLKKRIDDGEIKASDVRKYIKWLETDYAKLIADKEKKLKNK